MLCIPVAPESRRLGKVDLLNAAGQADIVEFRLDRLEKDPDIPDLISGISKPILISCRRAADGGGWTDSEDERLMLLRKAIVAGPAYIELELDIANKVPRFGKTQRVISYTQMTKPLDNPEPLYEKAVAANADVVKFVAPTPTLDGAWPLLAGVTKKRKIPLVGMGIGKPGVMFTLLGAKYGAPWIYAALEKGLEAYDGQSTITELDELYRWRDITPQTRLVAVTGFGDTDTLTVKILNAAFAQHQLNIRCLPMELGRTEKCAQMLDALHINIFLANSRMAERALNLATELDEAARVSQYADLVVKQPDGWHAFNTIWKSALKALETKLGAKAAEDRPLDKRNVLVVGADGAARGVAYGIQRRKGLISVTAADDAESKRTAQMFNARFVPLANLYDTLCDVVIMAEAVSGAQLDSEEGAGVKLNPSFLRPHMTVLDMTGIPAQTKLLKEARVRGCQIVDPADVFGQYLKSVFKTISGKDLSDELLAEAIPKPEEEDE